MGTATRFMISAPEPWDQTSGSRPAAMVAMVMIFGRRRHSAPVPHPTRPRQTQQALHTTATTLRVRTAKPTKTTRATQTRDESLHPTSNTTQPLQPRKNAPHTSPLARPHECDNVTV